MVSFMKLWENMALHQKDAEHIDTGAMKAIRNGLNIRDNFWDDFLSLLNNREALSDLLGVRPEQMATWASNIKRNLDRVHQADTSGEGEKEPKTQVLDTGGLDNDTGGIAINTTGGKI